MGAEKEDRILNVMEGVCREVKNGKVQFVVLKEIYDKMSKHPNATPDQMAELVVRIIDSSFEEDE